jgi:threonine/homoserine/homoserine lactone efflux protein
MALDHWLAFVAASALMLAIPGPTVLLIISYALGHGRKPAVALVGGVALADLTTMTTSMLGLGAVLAASAPIFTAVRWAGAAYLVYLGIKLWRAPVAADPAREAADASTFRMAAHAWLVTALNPKGIVFFVAFVPQFLDASRPFWPQVAVLEATFVALSALNSGTYALLASSARHALQTPQVRQRVNRTGGALLVGAGLFAAGWRKASA